MRKNLEEITADVAMLRGELPALECDPGDLPFPGLKDMVRLQAERCGEESILECDFSRLTGWIPLPCEELTIDSHGKGLIPLPDDFLMLHSLMLTGWQRPVTEVGNVEDSSYKRQWQGVRGAKGNLSRPAAFIETGKKGKRMLALYSCISGAVIAEGHYMPAPRFNEADEIEIPECAYVGMVKRLARSLGEEV